MKCESTWKRTISADFTAVIMAIIEADMVAGAGRQVAPVPLSI